MRILIVDDEPLVRVGIKSSYDWEGNGFEIAGEAEDGEKALRMIENLKPNIVILDIKMPKKDGLQVLEELQQRKIETYVIVLSSFDDLDHVKKAMKLGAKDYFHKPAMNGSLIAEALKQFKDERVKMEKPNPGVNAAGEAVIELLKGRKVDPSVISLKERNLSFLVLKVKDHSKVMSRYRDDEQEFFYKSFVNIMKEILSKEKETEFAVLGEEEFALLISQSQSHSAQECQERINKLIAFTASSIKRLMNIELIFGVSNQIYSFRDIPQAYMQARTALDDVFFESAKSVFFYQNRDGQKDETCLEEANSYISRLKVLLSEGAKDEFRHTHSQWSDYIQNTHCIHEQDLKKIYKGFSFMMINDEDEYFQAEKRIDGMDSFEQLSDYFASKFSEEDGNTAQLSPIIKSILNYINKNYQQDISLKQLAEEFYVSPNYVSKLFNKEMNRGLLDYVNEIRVSRAKKRLMDYQYKIYEVAEMVGFNSQVHFNIVFHKYVGMSPKEYRKSSL